MEESLATPAALEWAQRLRALPHVAQVSIGKVYVTGPGRPPAHLHTVTLPYRAGSPTTVKVAVRCGLCAQWLRVQTSEPFALLGYIHQRKGWNGIRGRHVAFKWARPRRK